MPTWRVMAERFETGDFSGVPRLSQKFILNKNVAIKAVRSWFVLYNNPTLTSISMKIYSDKGGFPYQELHTFNTTWTKAQITTEVNANKELYFEFTTPPNLKDLNSYHIVPIISGYTGSESSHVSWVRGVPDPVYTTNLTLTVSNRKRAPFKIGIIGHEL